MRKFVIYVSMFLLGMVLIPHLSVLAQVSTEYHSYTNDREDLFWPMAVPMYLHLSDRENGAASELIISNGKQGKDGGLYFQKEGLNLIRSKWAVGEDGKTIQPRKEVAFEIYIDGSAPQMDVLFETKRYLNDEKVTYYGKGLKVSCLAIDTLSGLENTWVKQDNNDFQVYARELTFEEEGEYALAFYAVDRVGNSTNLEEYSFVVDLTPPYTLNQWSGNFTADILAANGRITLSAKDKVAGVKEVYYKFDDGQYQLYQKPLTMAGLKDGEHALRFYAVDNVRNKEPERVVKFYLDITPPEIQTTVIGEQYQNRGRVFVSDRNNVQLSATDNRAGVSKLVYRVDGGEIKPYREPFVLRKIDGLHVIEVFAEDKVKNKSNGTFDDTVLGRKGLDLDVIPPVIAHKFTGPQYQSRDTVFITKNTVVALSAVDDSGEIKKIGYKLNGSNGREYLDSFLVEEEGVFTVDFFATDKVYNRNSNEFYFVVDNSGPELHSFFSSRAIGKQQKDGRELEVYTKGVKLYLAATDSQTDAENIYFSINNGSPSLYTSPIFFNNEGVNTISVSARDKLGNDSAEALELQFFIQ